MAAYAQFGYGGYPSANQLLAANSDPSTHAGDASTTNKAQPHSPDVEVRINSTVAADASSGALSPDGLSQASNVACASAAPGGASTANNTNLNADSSALGHVGISTTTTCCENGRPILTDPVSGQTVCSCQYDSARLALSGYSRLPTAGVGVYGTPYPSTDQNPYQSIGVDSSAFYSPLSNPYTLKDSTTGSEMTAWTSAGLQPTTGYYSYDPMGAYGYGASYDLAARRKNATRESTATLKAWLNEHKKNPYPTKGEKIMLAIITKMTLTQVSTWFANARRRLKKENKMTWEPKNRTDDDDDALVSDDEKGKDDLESEKPSPGTTMIGATGSGMGVIGEHRKDSHNQHLKSDLEKPEDELPIDDHRSGPQTPDMRTGYPGTGYYSGSAMNPLGSHPHNYHPYHHSQHAAYYQHQQAMLAASYHPNNKEDHSDPKNQVSRDCGVPIPATKPKIWSLADTVACKTPPPPFMGPQQQLHQMTPQQHMSANLNMATLAPLRQQQQQQQQQHQLQQQHIMNNFVAAPFSRGPSAAYGGFLGTTVQHLHTTNNSPYHSATNNNGSSNNSSSTSNIISGNSSNTSTTPTLAQLQQQQQHLQQQQHQHHQQHSHQQHQSHHQHTANQGMGFPEVQPDTPPQTPPNMKMPSVAANLLVTATQTPTIDTYRSTNAAFAANMTTRFNNYSPRDDCSSRSSSSGSEGAMNEANYQPFFRGKNGSKTTRSVYHSTNRTVRC